LIGGKFNSPCGKAMLFRKALINSGGCAAFRNGGIAAWNKGRLPEKHSFSARRVRPKWLSVKRKNVLADPHNALVEPYNVLVRACEVLVRAYIVPVRACNIVVEACDVPVPA